MLLLKDEKRERYKNFLVAVIIVSLLLLRFPLLIIPSFFKAGMSFNIIRLIFQVGTYLLSAILLIIERDRLAQFKFNIFAIVIFLLAPIIKLIAYLDLKYKVPLHIMEFWLPIFISGLLIVFFILNYKKLHKENIKYYVKWTILSILVGILASIGISFIYNLFSPAIRSDLNPSFNIFICSFFIQLSNAAVNEEPLFRGFIWGLLEKSGWKQYWIWLFQAGIFCIGHIYYLPQNPIFLIGTFIVALILGLLVWRSKSIGTSMIAHGIMNSLSNIILHYTW